MTLLCEAGRCTCQLEPLSPPGPLVTFEFAAQCLTLEQAHQLVLEQCLKGMQMAPPPPLPEDPPLEAPQ